MSRHGVLVAEKEHLLDQVRELKQQRTLNARRIRAANLEVRGAANAVWKLRGVQGQHEELWSSDAVAYAEDYLRLAVHAQELKVHMKVLKAQVKAMDADMASSADCSRRRLRWAMAQGAYDDRMRVMAMELMGKANVCATQVPSVIDIVARYYGIHIPERVKGRGYMTPASSRGLPPPHPQHVSTHPDRDGGLVAAPSGRVHHREGRLRGPFAIHSDGATSDGTKMSAFVLGQRSADATGASKISNLLLEMKSSNDRTSKTRVRDFRKALLNTTELCEMSDMAQAELIADLLPSAAMNDRAAPERLAARIMLGTDLDGPTCGEHGGLVIPMHAGMKAMDKGHAPVDGHDGRGDQARLENTRRCSWRSGGTPPLLARRSTPSPNTARSTATRAISSARGASATLSIRSRSLKQRMERK